MASLPASTLTTPEQSGSTLGVTPKRKANVVARRWLNWWLRRKAEKRQTSRGRVTTRLTREGFQFLFMITFVWVAAVLQNINLLILLSGAFCAMLVVQWRVASRSLSGLNLERTCPKEIQARRPFKMHLQVKNPRRWLGSWLLMLHESVSPVEGNSAILRKGHGLTLLVDRLLPGETKTLDYFCVFPKRGAYRFEKPEMSTRFPLSLMRSVRWVKKPDEVIARPTLGSLKKDWRATLGLPQRGQSQMHSNMSGGDGEFFGLRAYRPGDSRKWIHWRTSARRNEIVVRQFEREEHHSFGLVLDLWSDKLRPVVREESWTASSRSIPILSETGIATSGSPEQPLSGHEAVELAIEIAATLLRKVVFDEKSTIAFTILDQQYENLRTGIPTTAGSNSNSQQVQRSGGNSGCLRVQTASQLDYLSDRLAIARPPSIDTIANGLVDTVRRTGGRVPLVVLSSRSIPTNSNHELHRMESWRIPIQTWNGGNSGSRLTSGGRVIWIDVSRTNVSSFFARG